MRFRLPRTKRLDSVPAVLAFEVYVLMTMKLRLKMCQKSHELESKLSEHGLSGDEGQRLHDRAAAAFQSESTFVPDLQKFLGIDGPTSVTFSSILWSEFDFEAVAGEVNTVGYRHVRGRCVDVISPRDLPTWSMDVAEFAKRFGPVGPAHECPLFDDHLPAYREHTYVWNGQDFGAGFSWGLFMFAAKLWPED
ncbi:hypothetical protein FZI91_20195 [Mycobacterium sp. CBMA271]|uniref:hypothetical protein n=1 Tax=unclassified Mycobacteroides TaxID=2618759 RepID=UPI0012DF3B5A|nr:MULTISPECIES: hypothetical protein [unclassified Mycobacteroides]MUM17002.1 hypothetical protein [Mycobacteroides sp. CBMA 326]MUM24009.1 hypothetical protein [Mycobacteroides sp. CBMA 271]